MKSLYSTAKSFKGSLHEAVLSVTSLLITCVDSICSVLVYRVFRFLRAVFVRSGQRFLEFRFYPVKPKRRSLTSVYPNKQIGIVIQGPVEDPQFTCDTALWYIELGAKVVIISTTTKLEAIPRSLRKHRLILWHQCTEPDDTGLWNTNRQIKSSYEGMQFLADLKIEYTIKTRTDQRCYSEFLLIFLSRLIDTFPSKTGQDRVIAVTNNTLLGKIDNVSDHFYFGRTSTLLKAFKSAERSLSISKAMQIAKAGSEKEFQLYRMSHKSSAFPRIETEQYLFSRITSTFIEYNASQVSLNDYIDALGDYWILVDPEDLDMFWKKSSIESNASWDNGHPFRWHQYSSYRATHEIWRIMADSTDFRKEVINDCFRARELSKDYFTSLCNKLESTDSDQE